MITVCEVKFNEEPFRVTAKVAAELRRKLAVLREETGTKKRFQLVLVTSCGVAPGAHARELVDHVVTADDLFRSGP